MSHSHTHSQGNPTRDEPEPFTFKVIMLQLHNRTTQHQVENGTSSLKIILKTLPFRGYKKPVSHESAAVLEVLLSAGWRKLYPRLRF